jgi:hypothetical protein
MEDMSQETHSPMIQQQPQYNNLSDHTNQHIQQDNQHNQLNNNSTDSPIINNSSPYSSVFNSQDMLRLSPINNTSASNNEHDMNTHQNIIDLTTQSPNQNDSEIISPRNLNNSIPTPMRDTNSNTTKDLGNLHPGKDT